MALDEAVSTLLSKVLVAFTIEVDERFESLMPHSATVKNGAGVKGGRPWLVSQVMWSNYLSHVDDDGTPVGALQARCRVSTSTIKSRLNHLGWWAYVSVAEAKGTRYVDQLVTLTPGGRQACEVFAPLPGEVEKAWRGRFGAAVVDELRGALEPIVQGAPAGLPRFLPVVDYGDGMRTDVEVPDGFDADDCDDLSTLLSRALTRFTLDFERDSPISLPHLQNVLRVLEAKPRSIKDIPLAAGVSAQAIDASLTFLAKSQLVDVDGKGAKSMVSLAEAGQSARTVGKRKVAAVEKTWQREHGTAAVERLRSALDRILGAGEGPGSKMSKGLIPQQGGWRSYKEYRAQSDAVVANPRAALPHHPMVLHRGGFPDGS